MATRRAQCSLALVALLLSLGGCASLPKVRTVEPSFAMSDTADTVVGRSAARALGQLQGPSGIHLLPRGPGAFLARMVLAEAAQRSIDAQYYIWQNDKVGKLLMGALVRAADRGVRVRLLIDDIGSLSADDETLLVVDAHPNIEVRLFNPAATRSARGFWVVTDFSRVNRRMHNKSFTVDNHMTIVRRTQHRGRVLRGRFLLQLRRHGRHRDRGSGARGLFPVRSLLEQPGRVWDQRVTQTPA